MKASYAPWFFVTFLILLLQCSAGAIRIPESDSSFADEKPEEELVLKWEEATNKAILSRVSSSLLGDSRTEVALYSSWLSSSPIECNGYPSRDYWSRRSYPIFVRSLATVTGSYSSRRAKEQSIDATAGFRRLFVSFRNAGLLISDDGGKTFRRPESQPMRFVGKKEEECDPPLYRDIVGIWQHPGNSSIILAVNIQDLLLSTDGGHTFQTLDFRGLSSLKSRNIFSSIAASVDSRGEIQEVFLGTAYNGVKRLGIQGKLSSGNFQVRIRDFNAGLPGLLHEPGITFYEQILDIRWIPESRKLVAATLFEPGFAVASTDSGSSGFSYRPVPGAATDATAEALDCNEKGCLLSSTEGAFYLDLSSGSLAKVGAEAERNQHSNRQSALDTRANQDNTSEGNEGSPHEKGKPGQSLTAEPFRAYLMGSFLLHNGPVVKHRPAPETEVKRPELLSAFYVSPTSARLKQSIVFGLIERYGFNAVVIDVKDDFGRLLYGSKLPMAREMSNAREIVPIRDLLAKLKERGIYTIARQVVFKDLRMYRYAGHRNAIKNRYSGGPWEVEGDEQWVDPFSQEVQSYNLDVAREVLALGFDEIQFDYIRFPSDGPIYQCHFSHAPPGAYRTEAIESFLRRARFTLNAPISIDIFGYNGIYRAGAVIGQDVLEMGSSVDFVSPMHYSSHFGTHYLNMYPRSERVHRLLELGTERPIRLSRGLFSVRPWLQAFPMMNHIWGYGFDYMVQQMQGSLDGGSSGFLFWGPIAEFPVAGQAFDQQIRRRRD
tara:strand:- start:3983 stop:6301 length:2319 start_codon:yes stop_codon:yes gene_type:complete